MKSQHLPTHVPGREMHFQVTLVIVCMNMHSEVSALESQEIGQEASASSN